MGGAFSGKDPSKVDRNGAYYGRNLARRSVEAGFDFRPAAMIEALGLLRPVYRRTTNYRHFGRPGLPWEG